MTMADEIQKLQSLREQGALSGEEFEAAKARLLAEDAAARAWNDGESRRPAPAPAPAPCPPVPRNPEAEARQWGLFLHLAQFAGFVVPFGGLILPLVLWQVKKDEWPVIDTHGRIVMNWQISCLIYLAVSIPLCFILVGIPLLLAVVGCGLVFPVIGAIRAHDGHVWRYPLSIPFLTVQ